ncbi:MAG: hypothetical protein ACI4SR_01385 [Faecalibacillus sp.]
MVTLNDSKNYKGVSQSHLDNLLEILQDYYQNETKIHISINDGRLKVNNAESVITGIYNHFITVKSYVRDYYQTYTIKLIDFQIGKVKILELEK